MIFFGLALMVLGCDQLTKFLIRVNLVPGESYPSQSAIRFTYVTNSGSAFGLLANQTFLLALTAVLGAVAILIYYRYSSPGKTLLEVSLSLQFGGAMGNLIDRLRYGYVVDFIDIRVWPVFNLADSALVVGVILLGYFILFPPSREKASN
ncbi:MAG: signal peptidase II [Chloroflexi bacterium]|nr:signal peptidase II [Chloroflexota bacterium]